MFFSVLLLFLSLSAEAEIYQWSDDQGQVHFSDKPQAGAKILKVDAGYSYYQLKKIYDGDTVLLSNGKKVRFLGVNTPEVEGRNKSAQAGGEKAKKWLMMALKNKKIRLETDVEKKDKYGRLLAHIFTEDDMHVNLELIKLGLASVNIYPPSLKYSGEFLLAERQAEQKGLGIWGIAEYAPKQAEEIKSGQYKGWQRVLGTVKNIRHSRRYSYLNVTDSFALKVDRKAQSLFPKLDSYIGKSIEVRGWINKHKNHYSLFMRHPSAIRNR